MASVVTGRRCGFGFDSGAAGATAAVVAADAAAEEEADIALMYLGKRRMPVQEDVKVEVQPLHAMFVSRSCHKYRCR